MCAGRKSSTHYMICLINYIFPRVAVIYDIESEAITPGRETTLFLWFRYVLNLLYDADVISEAALLQWIKKREGGCDEDNETGGGGGSGDDSEDDDVDSEEGGVPRRGGGLKRIPEALPEAVTRLFQQSLVQEFVRWIQSDDDDDDDDEEEEDGDDDEEGD